jgi:hypothetical protein
MYSAFKRFIIGRPLATREFEGERLRKLVALPIFAADAIASSAFATQEILVVLVPVAGMVALGYLVPISLLVVLLLVIVVASYRQTLYAYPNGGGSYIVSRPVLQWLDDLDARWDYDVITVVIPEFVVRHWWEQLLHNQSALWLKARLRFRKGTVVTSVPSHAEPAADSGFG